MSKGEQTREMILERAAGLFNQQGYFGSSLADIMHKTGLEKGGIYNHFESKEQLALEAFDYAYKLVQQRVQSALEGKKNAIHRLLALISVFQGLAENSPIEGGCPVLNTAIEADDAHGPLRDRARNAMNSMRATVQRIVTRGIERKEVRPEVDVDAFATVFISTLEGAIMLTRLYQDTVYMHHASDHLKHYIKTTIQQ